MRELMERPIELVPDKVRALMGARRGGVLLPMRPAPVVDAAVRGRLRDELTASTLRLEGIDRLDDVGLLDAAFRWGLIPDLRCPWGHVGDLLWVREPWAQVGRHWRYCNRDACKGDELTWLPAVRMPRAAARLVLEIEDVGIARDADGRFAWCLAVEVRR